MSIYRRKFHRLKCLSYNKLAGRVLSAALKSKSDEYKLHARIDGGRMLSNLRLIACAAARVPCDARHSRSVCQQ